MFASVAFISVVWKRALKPSRSWEQNRGILEKLALLLPLSIRFSYIGRARAKSSFQRTNLTCFVPVWKLSYSRSLLGNLAIELCLDISRVSASLVLRQDVVLWFCSPCRSPFYVTFECEVSKKCIYPLLDGFLRELS